MKHTNTTSYQGELMSSKMKVIIVIIQMSTITMI